MERILKEQDMKDQSRLPQDRDHGAWTVVSKVMEFWFTWKVRISEGINITQFIIYERGAPIRVDLYKSLPI